MKYFCRVVSKHPAYWHYPSKYSGEACFVENAAMKAFWKAFFFVFFLEFLIMDNVNINPSSAQVLWYLSFNSNFKSIFNLLFFVIIQLLFLLFHVFLCCFCLLVKRRDSILVCRGEMQFLRPLLKVCSLNLCISLYLYTVHLYITEISSGYS